VIKRFFIIITLLFSFISGKALAISLGDLKKTLENATEEIKKEIDNNSNQSSEKKKTDTKSGSTKKEVVKEENKIDKKTIKNGPDINLNYCFYNKENADQGSLYINYVSISDNIVRETYYDINNKVQFYFDHELLEVQDIKIEGSNKKIKSYHFDRVDRKSYGVHTDVWFDEGQNSVTFVGQDQRWETHKCPDEEAIELIKNGTFNYSTYEEYLVAKEREKTKSVVYDNYKGTMICTYLQATLEIKSGKITRFTTSRFNMSNEYGEWRVIEEKSDPKKLFIHVKAINNVSNSFNEFTYDFKYYLYKDFFGNTEEQCEKKLEF